MTFDLSYTTEINLSKEYILSKINEEEIWSHYGVPITKGLFCSKLRNDKNPTCALNRTKTGRLMMKDFGTNWYGDCFAYVSELFHVSFNEALVIIANDFNLIKSDLKKNKPKLEYNGEKIELKSTSIIQVEIRQFQQYELDWWAKQGITEKTLKKYKVFSCKNVWLNGNLFHLEKDNQLVFGYYGGIKDGIELWRIYMPGKKRYKFISNWSASKLQGAKQLNTKNTDLLVLQKSLKDAMLMHEYEIPSIAPNSENTPISDKILDKLESKYKIIAYVGDNDEPGLNAIKKLKERRPEIICYSLPISCGCKDFTDFRKKHGKKATDNLIMEFKEYIHGQTNEKINSTEDRQTE